MYAYRMHIEHACVKVGIPLSQYRVVWFVCIKGMLVGLLKRVLSFASWLAILLPIMPMCALTFCIVILCVEHVIWLTMAMMSSLSWWLCWDNGCCMWLFIRLILLKLFVKTRAYCMR